MGNMKSETRLRPGRYEMRNKSQGSVLIKGRSPVFFLENK